MSDGFDVRGLLAPVTADKPAGDNLEYEPAFSQLDRLAEGRPEQRMGDQVIAAEEPDHRAAAALAVDLLKRSKDLRIAAKLTVSWLRVGGLPGLAAGLELIRGLLESFWPGLHPENDPSDPDDPTRANVLLVLAELGTLNAVRNAPLVEARGLGRFSYRDVAVAAGELPAPAGGSVPTMEAIMAAFAACPLDDLTRAAEATTQALGQLAAIGDAFGTTPSPDLAPLATLLGRMRKHLDGALARRTDGGATAATDTAALVPTDGAEGGVAAVVRVSGKLGELRSREDVIRVLDNICEYYAINEPSSPVPLLLRRAKRLVTASFLDIVKNIAPDSLSQFTLLAGPEEDSDSSS